MKPTVAKPATLEYSATAGPRPGPSGAAPRAAEPIARSPIVILIVLLLMAALWRLILALGILAKPSLANNLGALIQWRQLDIFAGPLALLLLASATRRWAAAATPLCAAGILFDALGLLMQQSGADMAITDGLLRSGIVAIALCAAVIVLRELSNAAKRLDPARAQPSVGAAANRGGLDLLDLWRLLTVQWVLVWAAAEVLLRFRFANVDLAANPSVRLLLFMLPAAGLVPNVTLWVTLSWARTLGIAGQNEAGQYGGRPRAWVTAMILLNIGALLLIISPSKAGIFGSLLMAAGLGLYLLGFPRGAWKRAPGEGGGIGGGLIAGSLLMLGIGVLLLGAAGFYSFATSQAVSEYALMGMRTMVYPAFPLVWLAGVGTCALRRCVPARWQPRQAGLLAAVLMAVAAVGTAAVFFAVAATGPEGGGFELLSATAILEAVGVGLGSVVALRGLGVTRVKGGA
ncbi:MAG TPA: hypothetical protein VH253_17905 [Phycisphaerae bacterium]|nr:hypothetical protein [Phycisphaerae bacterium]